MRLAHELPPVTLVDDATVEENIRRVATLLCAYREMTQQELGERIGIGKGSFSMRMNGKRPFRAAEVARMAVVLGAPVQAFYDGPDALFELHGVSLASGTNNAFYWTHTGRLYWDASPSVTGRMRSSVDRLRLAA